MSQFDQVHSTKKYRLGITKKDSAGNEYIYLKGVASLVAGDAVTYDELGATALLAANAKGPVAFAQATVDSTSEYGWFGIAGKFTVNGVANSADNATIGRETTDGKVGDGRAAGDEINNCIARSATSGAGNMTVQCRYPFVNDATGS
jgi:hypothetical protein